MYNIKIILFNKVVAKFFVDENLKEFVLYFSKFPLEIRNVQQKYSAKRKMTNFWQKITKFCEFHW